MRNDLYSNVSAVLSLNESDVEASATGTSVDLRGFDSVKIVMICRRGIAFNNTNHVVFVLQESDDDSTWADVANAADVQGVAAISNGQVWRVPNGAADSWATGEVGYVGSKRYLRVDVDEVGTVAHLRITTNVAVAAQQAAASVTAAVGIVERGHPNQSPVTR